MSGCMMIRLFMYLWIDWDFGVCYSLSVTACLFGGVLFGGGVLLGPRRMFGCLCGGMGRFGAWTLCGEMSEMKSEIERLRVQPNVEVWSGGGSVNLSVRVV